MESSGSNSHNLWSSLARKTPAESPSSLVRHPHFGWIALTTLGIGAIIGAGIFSMPGTIAGLAGPAGILSFVITGFIMICVARCYHAFSERLPHGVSAYSYVYHSLGEFLAVVVAFGLFVEYVFGTSVVAQAWSEYLKVIATSFGLDMPQFFQLFGLRFNVPAMVAIGGITLLLVSFDVRKPAALNAVLVAIKLALLAAFIFVGFKHFQLANLTPFMAFGVMGVLQGAALAVFPYVGFDQLFAFVLESKQERDTSIATYMSVLLSGALYICVMIVMVGAVPTLVAGAGGALVTNPLFAGNEAAAALAKVLSAVGEGGAAQFIGIAAVIGLFNVLLVSSMAAPRVFRNMAEDGLLPPVFSVTRHNNPIAGTLINGFFCCLLAGLVPFENLAHMMVLGTLVAFVMVGIGAWRLRLVSTRWALLTVAGCAALITQLNPLVFTVYSFTMLGAIAAYFLYGFHHSKLAYQQKS